jgi:hypothetical protein
VVGVFLCGAHLIREQDRRLTEWVEVEATVLRSEVLTQTASDAGTTHIPVVEYAYQFEGADHSSDRVFPLVQNAEAQRAHGVVSDHPAGLAVTVWVDPSDPRSAYLLREPSIFPHAFALMALLAFEVVVWACLSFLSAVLSDDGDLMGTVWGGLTALWLAGTIPILRHAHGLTGHTGQESLRGMTIVAVGVALLGLGMTIRHLVRKRRAAAAQAFTS